MLESPIHVVLIDGDYMPILVCSVCECPVQPEAGTMVWDTQNVQTVKSTTGPKPYQSHAAWVVHTGACLRKAQESAILAWAPLAEEFKSLNYNLAYPLAIWRTVPR